MQSKHNPPTTQHHDVRATRPRVATTHGGTNSYAVRMWVRQFNTVRVLQHQQVPTHTHA